MIGESTSNLSLDGKVILVTGVSRAMGIGAEITRVLTNAGAKVLTHGYPVYDQSMQFADADHSFPGTVQDELVTDGNLVRNRRPEYQVNCINPGPTDMGYQSGEIHQQVAERFPGGKWGMPADAARLVHFLQSDYSSWITGETISNEGGFADKWDGSPAVIQPKHGEHPVCLSIG